MEETPTIVIDNGSGLIKSGFGGDDEPRHVFPTMIQRKKSDPNNHLGRHGYYVGDLVSTTNSPFHPISNPIEKGIINHFEDIETIWYHNFYYYLKAPPEEYALLLTDVCWNTKEKKQKIIQIMFENFDVPAFYLSDSSSLSLYSFGKTSGVVFQSGEEVSSSVPVFEGLPLSDSVSLIDYSGKQVTEKIVRVVAEKGFCYSPFEKREIIQKIKENCFVSLDFEKEMKNHEKQLEKQFELPDGKIIKFGKELFEFVEPFFQNSSKKSSIQQSLFCSISKNDSQLSNLLFSNVFICGGSAMFRGMKERIEKETTKILGDSSLNVQIYSNPERKYSAWTGASILSTLSIFENMYVLHGKYDEYGPAIVNHFF